MLRKIVVPLLLIATLLAACGGEAQAPEVEAPAQEGSPAPTDEEVSEPTEAADVQQEEEPAPSEVSTGEFVSECAIADSLAEGSSELEELFGVRDTDWVVGPEDAAITLVEYGDFQ